MFEQRLRKALITGNNGFVGKYLTVELKAKGYDVYGVDMIPGENTIQADILNERGIFDVINLVQPDVIFHLAGQASVAKSWDIPQRTFEVNVIGTINLIEAVKVYNKSTRIVLIGSADQYGEACMESKILNEDIEPRPQTPYAVSKKAQEELAGIYVKAEGMNICMTRSFNHSGAGQKEGYIISDFCSAIAKVEKGLQESIKVGNLQAKRDFTHVKDIVNAYRLIGEKGVAGGIYNVGSGTVCSVQEILDRLLKMAKVSVKVEQDPSKLRISDTQVLQCDNRKLVMHTGWKATHGLDEIIKDTLNYYREKDF